MGLGQHVISSLSTDEMWGFEVYMYSEPGYSTQMIRSWTVPQSYEGYFAAARDFYVQTAGALVVQVDVDIGDLDNDHLDGASVYDIVGNGALKTQLGDTLGDWTSGVGWIDTAKAHIAANTFRYIGLHDGSITYVVTTEDGGTVVFRTENGDHTPNYVEGESRTPAGNPVPEDDDEAAGLSFTGEPGNFLELFDYLGGLGAYFTEQGTGDVVESISCTWSENNGVMTLACTVRYIPIP